MKSVASSLGPLLSLLSLCLLSSLAFGQTADTVLINGKIVTVDQDFSIVEALAVADGRILARGSSDRIAAMTDDRTEVIDLDGATVIPGLIDNHFHFTRAVQRWHLQARLDGITRRSEALDRLADKAAQSPPGQWVIVQGGWFTSQFGDDAPVFTLTELDRVAPDNPLFLQEGYQTVYANSLALQAVGLDPEDGARRNAAGLATFQPPYGSLIQAIPRTSDAQLAHNLDDFMHTLNSAGLTGLYSIGRGPEGEDSVLEQRAADGDLPLRIWRTLTFEAEDPSRVDDAIALIRRSTPNTFDGQFGRFGLGEHVYLPFFDLPGQPGPWPEDIVDDYLRIAEVAAHDGWHIHEHTLSNHSVSDLLARFEILDESIPLAALRWSLAHVYDITPGNIDRAAALGMTLAIHGAAMHAGADIPFGSMRDSGIVFGFGTDATVVSHYQPFITLGWAVSGRDLAGRRVLSQPLSREQALIAHTRGNAFMFFQEDQLGSLEVGKYADLVVLDRDYLTVPAEEIRRITPLMTMVGGEVVYQQLNHYGVFDRITNSAL